MSYFEKGKSKINQDSLRFFSDKIVKMLQDHLDINQSAGKKIKDKNEGKKGKRLINSEILFLFFWDKISE